MEVKCHTCDIIFENDISKIIHDFRVHGKLIKCFKCSICKKLYPSRDSLKLHKSKIHNSKHDEQSKLTVTKPNIETQEKVITKFKCDICEKTYDSVLRIKAHFKYTHNQPRNVRCDQCHNYYETAVSLDQHKKRIHPKYNQEEIFECDICEKKFATTLNIASVTRYQKALWIYNVTFVIEHLPQFAI